LGVSPSRLEPHAVAPLVQLGQRLAGGLDLPLHLGNDLLGLLVLTVRDHPPRALGDVAPQVDDPETENRADEEGDAPPDVLAEPGSVEQEQAREGADCGSEPVRAVNR